VSVLALAGISLNAAPQAFFSSDLTLHQTQTSSGGRGGERTVNVTSYLSGNAMKTSSSDGSDSILRLDEGKLILIDNNKKTYSETTFQQLQDMMDKAMGGQKELPPEVRKMMGATSSEVSVTKAGPGENVAGYPTEKYLMKGPIEMEIWAAPGLKMPPQYYDAIKLRMPPNPMFDFNKIYNEMKKIDGMPVKQVVTMKMTGMGMNMEVKSTTVVTSIDKGAIPKTTFDIPAGYKKVEFMK
jgi:hypothetical protein